MSPVERVRAAYARMRSVDRPEVWIALRAESDAVVAAAELEARAAAGEVLPLAGVVLAVKDNIDVAGFETTAGCPGFAYAPDASAPAVARLEAAGAIVLGKTNLDQFATGLVGTRSPYGAVRGALDPQLVSGGSSSGSAVAVALGVADVGVGTDTAGSGRVPAAFNGIVGIKPTRGLLSLSGVVPAARPYDSLSVFARSLPEARLALSVMTAHDPEDPQSRVWPADVRLAAPERARVGVPGEEALSPCSPEVRDAFAVAVATLQLRGHAVVEVDAAPFLRAAELLYGSALVAERYAAVGRAVEMSLAGLDPVVGEIVRGGREPRAYELAEAQEQLRRLRAQALSELGGCDALLVPTTVAHPSLEEVLADPVGVNSRLGTYTNFVNLFDLAAVAVPAPGTPAPGVTLVGRAFEDQVLLDIAADLVGEQAGVYPPIEHRLAVFGAHLRGQPLNHQLRELGARFLETIATAPGYRMVALEGAVAKPGLLRDPTAAGGLEGELWGLSAAALGRFLTALPDPMRLGSIDLADGRQVTGFHCDPIAAASAPDITSYGSWLGYLAARS